MQLASSSKMKKSSTSSVSPAGDDPLSGQMLISVGRMEYDYDKMRGVLDKSFVSMKLPFHRDCTAKDMLRKCKEYVWDKADSKNYEYYLADRSGTTIGNTTFNVDLPKGGKQKLPWTLNNYLRVSNVRYPSRLRLYCMRKLTAVPRNDSPDKSDGENGDKQSESAMDVTRSAESAGGIFDAPMGYLDVQFMGKKKSEYRNVFSFRSGMTQEDLLAYQWEDMDRMFEVRDMIATSPSVQFQLYMENPLEHGFYSYSISDESNSFSFVESTNSDTGNVLYQVPLTGATFDLWCGCYSSKSHVALLACITINGYHSSAKYVWEYNGKQTTHDTPLLYCNRPGSYVCYVTCCDRCTNRQFKVEESGKELVTKMVPRLDERNSERKVPDVETEPAVEGLVDAGANNTSNNPFFFSESPTHAKAILESCDEPETVRLLEVIGSGAFGQVHKAVWRGTIVAAKVIHTAGNEKVVENELSVYRTLHHPNVLTFMGLIREPGTVTIITNYVAGKNLFELIHNFEKATVPYDIKVKISLQICQALVYMHSCEPTIVHLDLKPENVLVENGTYHVYLADFGLGKVMSQLHVASRTTMQAGTPAFQPPEQLKGEKCGKGSDVYALGCIMTELYGEKPVWEGMAPHTIILKVAGGDFPSVSHLPPEIRGIVGSCFVVDKDRASAVVLLKEICKLCMC